MRYMDNPVEFLRNAFIKCEEHKWVFKNIAGETYLECLNCGKIVKV